MKNKIKREFIVLGVITHHDLTPLGNEKVYHEFKKLGSFPSLDCAICFIYSRLDGSFRIVRKCGKRFMPTLTCKKFKNIIQF